MSRPSNTVQFSLAVVLRHVAEHCNELMDEHLRICEDWLCNPNSPAYSTKLTDLEIDGAFLDFDTGHIIHPVDDWLDFTQRWTKERQRNGNPITASNLSLAAQKANFGTPIEHAFKPNVCQLLLNSLTPTPADTT